MAGKRKFSILLLSLLITIGASCTASIAQNPPATAGGAASPAGQITSMKTEQTQLRRMSEAIKRTRRAAVDLIGECTQPVEMEGEIDVIGQEIIPIMPSTAGGFANQYIDPRPKYVKLHMTQLAQMIPILQDEIENLEIPDSEKAYAQQSVADIDGFLIELKAHFKQLKSLTKGDDYDRMALVTESRSIDTTCKAIDSARKKLLHEDTKLERKEEKILH